MGSYIHLVLSNGLIILESFKIFQIINRLKLATKHMVSKTGKTQVPNNSIGIYLYIWQYEQIHWQKNSPPPLCIKHAMQVLLSVQTVIG